MSTGVKSAAEHAFPFHWHLKMIKISFDTYNSDLFLMSLSHKGILGVITENTYLISGFRVT